MKMLVIKVPEDGLEINGHVIKLVNKEKERKRKRIISNIVTYGLIAIMMLGLVWFFNECADKQFDQHVNYIEKEYDLNK